MGLTLAGLVVGAVYGWVLLRAVASPVEDVFALLTFVPFAVGGLALVVAGLWDLLTGMDLASLRRRVARFASLGVRWVDCYSTRDPVPNGRLLEQRTDAAGSEDDGEIPSPVEVCNEGSTVSDHTAYWRNRDELVSRVVAELTAPPAGRRSILAPRPAWGDAVAPRRRWRVDWLTAIRWLGWAAAALAVVAKWSVWESLIAWSMQRMAASLGELFGREPTGARLELEALAPALGVLLLAAAPVLAARYLWRRWDEAEMRAGIAGGRSGQLQGAVMVAVSSQSVLASIVASFVEGRPWLPILVIVAGLAVLVGLIATQLSPPPPAPAFVAPPRLSRAGCAWTLLLGFASLYFTLLSWLEPTVEAWTAASWWKLSGLLLVAAVVVAMVVVGVVRRRKR